MATRFERARPVIPLAVHRRIRDFAIALLVVTRVSDGATTLVGLTLYSPMLVEHNRVLAVLIARWGTVPAVVVGTLLSILIVVAATETACLLSRRLDSTGSGDATVLVVRAIGYAPIVLISTAATLNNVLWVWRLSQLGV